jgi:hypothetical protein
VQKTNPVLTTNPRLQDKIARIKRYRENSFISLPVTCGKLCGYCSKGVHREKRHLRGCSLVH